MRERTRLEKTLGIVREIQQGLDDAVGLIELAEAENDQATLAEAVEKLQVESAQQQRLASELEQRTAALASDDRT